MKSAKFSLFALSILACAAAFAGGNNEHGQSPQPTSTIAWSGIDIKDSGNSTNSNSAFGGTASAQGGFAASQAAGGNGGNSAGGSSTNNNNVLFERSAPSVSSQAPVYVRNCRIGIGGGGSNANGSFTAAIPLGNDMTCLVGAKLEAMIQTNLQRAGTFTPETFVQVACDIEGMDTLPECKVAKGRK